jgi:hypothetical protein
VEHLVRHLSSQGVLRKVETSVMVFKLMLMKGLGRTCLAFRWIDQPLAGLLSEQCCQAIKAILQGSQPQDVKKAVICYYDRLIHEFCLSEAIVYNSPLLRTDSFFRYVTDRNSLELCLLCSIRSFLIEEEIESRAAKAVAEPSSSGSNAYMIRVLDPS